MTQKQSRLRFLAIGLLLLCTFANPLEQLSPIFKWIDELICLGAVLGGAVLWLPKPDLRRQIPKHLLYFIPFFLYMFMQLLGTLTFRFQPWGAVIIDALTNAKFWLTVYGCYLLSRLIPGEDVDAGLLAGAKAMSALLFVLFFLEQMWVIFPDGLVNDDYPMIQCSQMMYHHPSYVAAVTAFLLATLLSCWNMKLIPYAAADLIILTFTFRAKAYGAVVAFLAVFFLVILWKKKVKIWHIAVTGVAAVAVAWERIAFYFIQNGGKGAQSMMSARSVLLNASLEIIQDYFPMGTGFATFASHQSVVHYSPVYALYGLDTHPAVGIATRKYIDDSFWPIVFAQSGGIGLIAFLGMLMMLAIKAWQLFETNRKYYAAALFALAYLLIISTAEPTFNNQTSMPMAMLMGYWFGQSDRMKREKGKTT